MKLIMTQCVIPSRIRVLISICLFVCATSIAAVENAESENSILVASDCSYSGTFTQVVTQQVITDGLPESDSSSGSIFYDCNLGLIWRTEQTVISTRILTTENLHYKLDEKDNINPLDSIPDLLQSKLLLSVLGGDDDFVEKNFTIQQDNLLNITLIPKTNNYKRGLQSIILYNNADEAGHMRIQIVDSKGQSIITTITQDQVYDSEQQGYHVCQNLYSGTEYCNILKNPIDYQSIDG